MKLLKKVRNILRKLQLKSIENSEKVAECFATNKPHVGWNSWKSWSLFCGNSNWNELKVLKMLRYVLRKSKMKYSETFKNVVKIVKLWNKINCDFEQSIQEIFIKTEIKIKTDVEKTNAQQRFSAIVVFGNSPRRMVLYLQVRSLIYTFG